MDTAPYFEQARDGVFALPKCDSCGKFHFYPRATCPHCHATRMTWTPASGRGEVYSFSVVHRAPSPAFKPGVPYVIAIVRTDEGPHLLSRVVGVAPESVKIGMRLKVSMQRVSDDAVLPVFSPE